MNIKEIEALLTVARSRSFYEAAYTLNYAPSVISKYVSSVEEELGVVLFSRGNRASSVSLTKEGETLMPHFIRMFDSYRQLQQDSLALRTADGSLLRIGAGVQFSSLGTDEILADFYLAHPEFRVEQTKMDFESLIHALYSGRQDGVFLLVQDGSANDETIRRMLDDPKIESFLIVREHRMYLGISATDVLAAQDAAPLSAFRDFSIAFNSDQNITVKAGTMAPFVKLASKSGFELKPIYIDPRDTSAFYLATQMKAAIPSLRCTFQYPGVKFLQVSDWQSSSTTYFLALKANRNKSLIEFIKTIQVFIRQENLNCNH